MEWVIVGELGIIIGLLCSIIRNGAAGRPTKKEMGCTFDITATNSANINQIMAEIRKRKALQGDI